MDVLVTILLIALLFVLLGSGLWIGLALLGVAWIGMELFTSRPVGDAMAVTIWGSLSSWTLTASPTGRDRKSTRLNSSHTVISYAVFCLKKKNTTSVTRALNADPCR